MLVGWLVFASSSQSSSMASTVPGPFPTVILRLSSAEEAFKAQFIGGGGTAVEGKYAFYLDCTKKEIFLPSIDTDPSENCLSRNQQNV